MNILIINHYAGSKYHGMALRPYYLAREWVKSGHQVRIIAASHSHLRKNNPQFNGSLKFEKIDGIEYCWIRTPVYEGNSIKRIVNILTFLFKLLMHKQDLLSDFSPDVVIASSTYPLDNYLACHISKKYSAKYIYEVHDLWPLSPMELGGYSKYHPYIMLLSAAEKFACKYCDRLVSILPKTKEYLVSRGLEPDKFCHVPNGISISDIDENMNLPNDLQALIDNLKQNNRFLLGYAGGISLSNAMNCLVEAAYRLDEYGVSIVIVGGGQEYDNLKKMALCKDLKNVVFYGRLEKECVMSFLKQMDCLYIASQKSELYRYGISPNKIFEYMYASKPILCSIRAGNDIVGDASCGMTVEPENIDDIIQGMKMLRYMSDDGRAKLGVNGHEYVVRHHGYPELAKKFLETFN